MFVLQVKIKVFFIRLKKKKRKEKENGSVHKNRKWLSWDLKKNTYLPKSDREGGSIIGHKIDYDGVGVLRGQWHIPSKNLPKYPSPAKQNLKCLIR